jgi:flavin-dependent dehydrogenase
MPSSSREAEPFDRPYDVVIAGAGLAGASLALRLANGGAQVALLDANFFPRDKVCGEYLSPECWEALDRLDLLPELSRTSCQPIRHVRITTPRGRIVETEVIGPEGSPGIGLSRATLDNALVRRAEAAGVQVLERTRCGSPIIEHGRVVGVHARHAQYGNIHLRASVTIAANGRHSSLVRATGQTRPVGGRRLRFIGVKRHFAIAPESDREPAGSVGLHLVGGGYCGTCRVDGSLTNVCALMPEPLIRHFGGDLDRVAAESFTENPALARVLGSASPAGEWKAIAGVRVEVATPKVPGILYAGDCQGTVDPLGGQGMTMALLSAEALVPFVQRALVSDEGVSLRTQRSCQLAWHRRFDRRILLCRIFHHALANPGTIDLVSAGLGSLAPRLLAASFRQTRDAASIGV